MFSRGEFDVKMDRRKLSGAEEFIDARTVFATEDPDKSLILHYIGQLVADGFAVWEMLDSGEIEVRFNSGETYLLAEATILRLA